MSHSEESQEIAINAETNTQTPILPSLEEIQAILSQATKPITDWISHTRAKIAAFEENSPALNALAQGEQERIARELSLLTGKGPEMFR